MIKYDFIRMHELASALNSDFKNLEQQADTLKSAVNSMSNNWKSELASGNYYAAQGKWDAEFADTRTILERLSRKVEESADRMQGADRKAAAQYSL